ncbi:hypothetical protein FKZ61_000105 [Litorilinea aerophila]|uniref:Uncharacterized protein n=1 Tax=Litorilinea aerophila TaxID=1204385 RepID=A0A540VM33_9CHLR|nr:hypothetical protein [Litorilinea aerophila]MCC9074518.1 hypothetical protein [Litorilinea aerophila]GIV75662.1 MAG: hypothetical protein KatS3mg050_0056 [Litorilinea sp.]
MTESGPTASTPGPAMQAWQSIVQTPELVDYFAGLFETVGITVAETGETFTVIHHGDRITFEPGIRRQVDFRLTLQQRHVEGLVIDASDGAIGPEESWRIVQVLFTPFTEATLRTPVLAGRWLRRLAGVEDLIHVHLLSPTNQEAARHTLIYAAHQWLVVPGLYGRPRRVYHLQPDDALTFQRQIFRAMKEDSVSGWWRFANWYRRWRERVSVSSPGIEP